MAHNYDAGPGRPGQIHKCLRLRGRSAGSTPGPLKLEGKQVGIVIYRVDGGLWQELTPNTTITGIHTVEVAYNDRPGAESYADNFGSLSLTIVRTKA